MSALRKGLRRVLLAVALAVGLLLALGVGSASAAGGWWLLNADTAPTKPIPGEKAIVLATAVNAGYATITGTAANPIVFKDTLPAGFEFEAKEVTAQAGPEFEQAKLHRELHFLSCTSAGRVLTCPWVGPVGPTERISLKVRGQMSASAAVGANTTGVEVSGGDAPAPAPFTKPLEVGTAATPFGPERYEIRPENAAGGIETQAGAHPFQMTSIFDLNQIVSEAAPTTAVKTFPNAPALPKDLHFVLPAGLIGKASGVPRCSGANFASVTSGGANLCPENTAIGYVETAIFDPVLVGYLQGDVPVFNLAPEEGEPARFGFEFHEVPVVLTTRVRSGKDYAVEVTVHEAPQSAAVISTQLTLWGVPKDPRHDSQRGWECIQEGAWIAGVKKCESSAELLAHENEERQEEGKSPRSEPESFLSMPTTCASQPPPTTSATGEAWSGETFGLPGEEPAQFSFKPFTGCEKLSFEPSIEVSPDKAQAATPSGYTVAVNVNQAGTISGKEGALADAAVKSTELTLPAGVFASAGATQGLGTCTSRGFGFEGFEAPGGEAPLEPPSALLQNNDFSTSQLSATECPQSARIGTVDIESPLLDEHVTGYVYLAREDTAPFTSPLVLYIFAETPTSKVQVKLAGEVQLLPDGRLRSVFQNTPPVQFSRLTLHLFDGPRAPQATPEKCGATNETVASFEASSGVVRPATSNFAISTGAGGGPCSPAFAPGFEAKAENPQAGAFSPFKVVIRRPDGQNQLRSISVTEPPGAAAILASVTPCPTAIAEQIAPETLPKVSAQSTASCPASSAIGKSIAVAGLGGGTYGPGAARVDLEGTVYLTGPYHGAPFGLLDVTNAEHVGPFDLGKIGVMSKITVNETTAQASITSNPLPQFVEGVPASISEILVAVDRPGFTFNPTNCNPLAVSGTLTGWGSPGIAEGVAGVSSPFHAANCGALPFKPTISVNVESNFSRLDGTGMKIKVTSGKGQSNIQLTHLVFPSSVPSRLTTIQKACPSQTFNVNPAGCPEGSVIGSAVARTPVLKSPLTGPAYLVSHANESFPDAVFVLQGEGIKLILDGKTNIKGGVTSSTFSSIPDAPVESFEVSLPRGPHSAFSGFGNLCEKPIEVPTTFGGQNGALLEGATKVTVENCGGVKKAKTESELAKLLKKCKKVKNHKKRVKCEATARKQVKAVATCKKKNKGHAKKLNSCVARARTTYALKLK